MNEKELINVKLEKGLKKELNEAMGELQELFNLACDLNQSDSTRTEFTVKTTTHISGILQTLSYIDGRIDETGESA